MSNIGNRLNIIVVQEVKFPTTDESFLCFLLYVMKLLRSIFLLLQLSTVIIVVFIRWSTMASLILFSSIVYLFCELQDD